MTYRFNKIERNSIYLFYGPRGMDVHWLYLRKWNILCSLTTFGYFNCMFLIEHLLWSLLEIAFLAVFAFFNGRRNHSYFSIVPDLTVWNVSSGGTGNRNGFQSSITYRTHLLLFLTHDLLCQKGNDSEMLTVTSFSQNYSYMSLSHGQYLQVFHILSNYMKHICVYETDIHPKQE